MVSFYLAFELGVAIFAALIGLEAGWLYRKIERERDSVLTKFKLQATRTYHDFMMLGVAEVLMVVAALIYVLPHEGGLLVIKNSRILVLGTLGLIAVALLRMGERAR